MVNETDERIENSPENKTPTAESLLLKEANAGKPELVDEQKELDEYLKSGGKSGITNEFGKPLLVEGASVEDSVVNASQEKSGAKESFMGNIASTLEGIGKSLADVERMAEKTIGEGVSEVGKELGTLVGQAEQTIGGAIGEIGKKLEEGEHAAVDGLGKVFQGVADFFHPPEIKMDPLEVRAPAPYPGEAIGLNFPPNKVVATPADTLESVAKKNLPPSATAEQLTAYEKEIATVNGLDPARPGSLDGKELTLPGGTTDGGMVIKGEGSRTITTWKNGAEKTEDTDGRGYNRQPDGAGGYKETHSGPRQGDQFELTTTPDGKMLIADKAGDTPREVPPASEEVKTERHKLLDLAQEKIADPERRAKFEADMLRFEERAAKQTPPLGGEEIAKTYKETERLLTTAGDVPLKQEDRVKVAEQVMSQCAIPKSIDQGQHETCNMTTAECTTYTRHPSEAARLVTDIATTGQYTAKDGTQVQVNPVAADAEARNNPPVDGDRSQASQIFQVAAVNLYYQKQPYTYTDAAGNAKIVPPGQIQYQQVPDVPGVVPPTGGERLIDQSTTPPTTIMKDWINNIPKDSPDLADRAMVDVPNIISGTTDATMIEHKTGVYGDATGVNTFENEEGLKNYIQDAAEKGKFPIVIGVHSGQEPFLHDSGNGAAGGSGGWHVVTITDYDAATGKVEIDNQWGTNADHQGDKAVQIHDLYRASRKPDQMETQEAPWYKPWESDKQVNSTIEDLQKDVDWDREHNTIDTQKEFELLRLKHQFGGMSDADFDKDLKQCIDDSADRWAQKRTDGSFDQNEYNNAQTKLKDVISALPPQERIGFIDQMHTKGMIDDDAHRSALVGATSNFIGRTHTDAQADTFMAKIKTMTDSMTAAQHDAFYQQINANPNPLLRLELAQSERKTDAINDVKYDDLIASTTTEFLSVPRSVAASSAYTARLQPLLTALPEDRRNAIVAKVPALRPAARP